MTKAAEVPMEGQRASDLVRRILAGEHEAEGELIRLYARGLSYMLRRLTSNRAMAEDLLQETFRIVLKKVRNGDLREPEKLSGFIRSTARNLSVAEFRKAVHRQESEEVEVLEAVEDPAPSQLSQVLQEEDRRLVRRLLAELRSARDREILYRFHIAEEDKEHVCAALDLTSRQFNLVLFRAHQRFKSLIEKNMKRQELQEAQRRIESMG